MKKTNKNLLLLFIFVFATTAIVWILVYPVTREIQFNKENIEIVNREIVPSKSNETTLALNRVKDDGMAILKDIEFDIGTIELELKGENNPQKSFIGIAFNIQNDSTYEAIYFRPFNFQSYKKIRREHSIQYIYKPNFEWRFLRKNHTGLYEAEFPRQPSPDDWFSIKIKINNEIVIVYDKETNTELLKTKRLTTQVSDRIAFWVGYNSKGELRNLKIKHSSKHK